ncbi:MAG: carbohydrate ABC transporter permease [Limnochordia bacterium]|jgi:multiple sugar transport system permease protein
MRENSVFKRASQSPYWLLSPALLVLSVVIFIPTIWSFWISFTDYTPGGTASFVGLENYIRIVRDPHFLPMLRNTIVLLLSVVSLEFLVGLGCGLVLSRGFPLQKLWVSLLLVPYAVSPAIAVIVWKYLLDFNYGYVNYMLEKLGFGSINWLAPHVALITVIIVHVWKGYPFIMLISYSSLTSIPLEYLEAAKIDGASGVQVFRHILLPLIKPALLVGLAFRMIFVIRSFDIIWVFTRGGPARATEILPVYLYQHTFRYYNYGIGAAVAWVLLGVTFVVSIYIVKRSISNIY